MNELLEYIDYTPNNEKERKALLKDLRAEKKELQLSKKRSQPRSGRSIDRRVTHPLPLAPCSSSTILEDGRFVVLNREHKPLGFRTRDHVKYEDHPIAVNFKGLTPKVAARLSFDGSEDLDAIALYNDGCIPTDSAENMKKYLDRLAVLAKLDIVD